MKNMNKYLLPIILAGVLIQCKGKEATLDDYLEQYQARVESKYLQIMKVFVKHVQGGREKKLVLGKNDPAIFVSPYNTNGNVLVYSEYRLGSKSDSEIGRRLLSQAVKALYPGTNIETIKKRLNAPYKAGLTGQSFFLNYHTANVDGVLRSLNFIGKTERRTFYRSFYDSDRYVVAAEQLIKVPYVMIIQKIKFKDAELIDRKTFEAGFYEGLVHVYRLADTKKIGTFSISATNSEQIKIAYREFTNPLTVKEGSDWRAKRDLGDNVRKAFAQNLEQLSPGAKVFRVGVTYKTIGDK